MPEQLGAAANLKPGRIDGDIERIATLARNLQSTTGRIVRLARTLGYYEPSPARDATAAGPTPISLTLQAVLNDLENAVNENSASLNLFD